MEKIFPNQKWISSAESTQRRERSEQETEADSKRANPKDWAACVKVQEVHQRV